MISSNAAMLLRAHKERTHNFHWEVFGESADGLRAADEAYSELERNGLVKKSDSITSVVGEARNYYIITESGLKAKLAL